MNIYPALGSIFDLANSEIILPYHPIKKLYILDCFLIVYSSSTDAEIMLESFSGSKVKTLSLGANTLVLGVPDVNYSRIRRVH